MGIFALVILGLLLIFIALGVIADHLPDSWEHRDAARRSAEPRYWRGPR